MTQGRDGISLAHARALELMGVARRLSLVAAVFVIAALVAGTAGTSYAGSKKTTTETSDKPRLEDTVVISNYGAVFDGSLETFLEGVGHNAGPKLFVHGPDTNLGASTGAAQDAVSSAGDDEIAVGLPIDFLDLDSALCGPFGQPAPGTVLPLLYGTGMVELFSAGANGNSLPDNIICSPLFAYSESYYPNTTGIFYPQGVAFESPYDGQNPGTDMLAVANQFPEVIGSPDCPAGQCDQAACLEAPATITTKPLRCSTGNVGPGASLGTITMYDRLTLPSGIANVAPSLPAGGWTVDAYNPLPAVPFTYTQNASIGGCYTLLAGPEGLTFDQNGYLFVVNNAGALAWSLECAPRYVTVYAAPLGGDEFPTSLIGSCGATCVGSPTQDAVIDPVAAAVDPDDNLFVTDRGSKGKALNQLCTATATPHSCCTGSGTGTCTDVPPKIQIFDPFMNYDYANFFLDGELLGTISGPHTHLRAPAGIAINAADDAMYVVDNSNNSLLMFTDFPTTGGDIPPTLTISGPHAKMNLPVGVALPAFTPTPAPSSSSTADAARD